MDSLQDVTDTNERQRLNAITGEPLTRSERNIQRVVMSVLVYIILLTNVASFHSGATSDRVGWGMTVRGGADREDEFELTEKDEFELTEKDGI